jgi:hypothetical protein
MELKTGTSAAAPRKNRAAKIPRGLPCKPQAEGDFLPPVGWLGGRELIASLKLVALYALFGDKLDARDWMNGVLNIIKDRETSAPQEPEAMAAQAATPESEKMYTRLVETRPATGEQKDDEFWFDYVADTGDGQMPTYNIAYLCLSHLHVSADGTEVHFEKQERGESLPRGKFLFIGGDTAYHVADYSTLARRFQAPFWWAYSELAEAGKIPEEEMRNPLFGIPGNHDHYDALDGFNRQFRRPSTGDDQGDARAPLLQLPTFERHQEASYVALSLPFDWWLWGLDTDNDELDFRQETFFRKLQREKKPKKLIVATPSPTTVFGKYLDADGPLAEAFKKIELKRPFLEGKAADELDDGECRLDLSGDIHHYARYWGPPPESAADEAKRPRAKDKNGVRGANKHYASVVSGGGGAFFDPTNTYFGQVKEQALFPDEETSRRVVSGKILNFLNILRGGSIHHLGWVMALLLCFAAVMSPGTRETLFNRTSPFPASAIAELAPIFVSLLLFIPGLVWLYGYLEKTRKRVADDKSARALAVGSWVFVLATFLLMAFGVWWVRGLRPLPPMGDSLMVFFAALWAGLMTAAYLLYTELLNERAKRSEVHKWEFWPTWAMLITAAVVFCAGVWFFGQRALPVHLFADLAFITLVLSVPLGLIALAVRLGGARHGTPGKLGYVLVGLWHAVLQLTVPLLWTLGLLRVLATKDWPYLWALLIPPAAYFVFRGAGSVLAGANLRQLLVAVWLLYGLLMIALPVWYLFGLTTGELFPELVEASGERRRLLLFITAVVFGALMSCVWFGWYLAVAMIFNGHNNEAGGAARLVGYKQFMRIRLRENDLTAYVLGFVEATPAGEGLTKKLEIKTAEGRKAVPNLRLVEKFTLTVKVSEQPRPREDGAPGSPVRRSPRV